MSAIRSGREDEPAAILRIVNDRSRPSLHPRAEDSPPGCRSLGRVDIQRASSLDQYAIADSYAPSSAGRDAVGVAEPGLAERGGAEPGPEAAPEQAAAAEEPPASTGVSLPGVYARNARPVAVRMARPSISLLA